MDRRIVIGVDGSEESIAALRWGAEEARLRGATLDVITVWGLPQTVYLRGADAIVPDDLPDLLEREAKELQAAALAEAMPEGPVAVEARVVEGQAARILIEASGDAELLVVGSRGLGGFRELLLGSVSHQCMQHARCPVVVVRGPRAGPSPVARRRGEGQEGAR